MKRGKRWDLKASARLMSTSANQELKKSYKSVCVFRGRNVVTVSIDLLTVKSLKTRFREPLRRAMRAALGWFTIAFGARGAGVLPAAGGVLYNTTTTHISVTCQIPPSVCFYLPFKLQFVMSVLTQCIQMKSSSQCWKNEFNCVCRWINKGVCTGKKSDWDFAPAAAPLV